MSNKTEKSWSGAAVAAGAAAIGSAALAAALLYAKSRREKAAPTAPPARPEDAPETD